jgi:hypothetical protein
MASSCTISAFHEPSLAVVRALSQTVGTCYFLSSKSLPTALPPSRLKNELGVTLVCVVGADSRRR